MASEQPKSADSAISKGREHYAAKQFKPALEQFTRAMRLCPCNRGKKRERCRCKNYDEVTLQGGSIFHEAMYKCSCDVGKTFNKCESEHHIQALDYRAATFEAIKELERAQRDAEWILELAPRQPDGYLRLGKIARLQKKDELAWAVYSAGIEAAEKNMLAGSSKLQKLYAARKGLQLRYSRKNPLHYPQEIVQRIFYYVDFKTIVRCLRVAKEWKRYLTGRGNELLWRSLTFTDLHNSPPHLHVLRKFVRYSNGSIQNLVIDNASRFKLDQRKFLALLQGCSKLDALSIKGKPLEEIAYPSETGILSNLTSLSLTDFPATNTDLLASIISNCKDSLQYLSLIGLPREFGFDFDLPRMPRLKYLRFQERDNSPFGERALELRMINQRTPNLEQLSTKNMKIYCTHLETEPAVETNWPKLAVLAVSGLSRPSPVGSAAISTLSSLHNGNHLKYLAYDFPNCQVAIRRWEQPVSGNQVDGPPSHIYKELRSWRSRRGWMQPENFQHAFTDTLSAQKLHTMDIGFPLEVLAEAEGATSTRILQAYDWLRGASCIKSLGIFHFRFKKYYRTDDEMPLPNFLASFPSLENLEIDSDHYEAKDFCSEIVAILKVTRLKRLYQTTVQGAMLDQLAKFTRKSGVELIFGERPREWPVPLEDE